MTNSPPNAHPDAALEFLRWWRPGGPWVLTAIAPDRKSIETQTFREEQAQEVLGWLDRLSGSRNIYFHVNPTVRDMKKKAEREDIAALAWLHVDIDPRAGEDIVLERARALALLTKRLPEGVPPPSAVVFSGGGYQGFWRLEEPYPINGKEEAYEEAKRWNQQLELLFGADNCHNVDRIMRLPGTINWPDAKKAKKGRVPTLAETIELHDDRVYPLSQFHQAPIIQTGSGPGISDTPSGLQVDIPGNVPRIADLSELDKWGVPDRVKVIITQGRHPDETKKGDNSRSAWQFDVACNHARLGVPDEVTFSIFMDPDYAISEGILDKGANAAKYARRQIERAKEHAINPKLREFNERYAVIRNYGGKCRVVEEVKDDALERYRLTRMTMEDFCNGWMNETVEVVGPDGKVTRVPAGRWWLKHPNRRTYDRVVFSPKREIDRAYNLWRGYGVTPRPGNAHQVFLDHTLDVICDGDKQVYDYVIKWLARSFQYPDQPGEVAIVLRGGMGVGKSRWAEWVARPWGRHALTVTSPGHLVGNFNAHLRDICFLFAEEAFYAGDKRHESVLKALITERMAMFEAKGVDAEQQPNYLHIVMASNQDWVVPTGRDERRYLILDVSAKHRTDFAYFQRFMEPLKGDGAANLLHYLLNLDLTGYNVRDVPKTKGLRDQKLHSMPPEDEWWMGKLEAGALLPEHVEWEREVRARDLQADYNQHLRDIGVNRRCSPTAMGQFLSKVCPGHFPRSFQRMEKVKQMGADGFERTVNQRLTIYELPDLAACREQFVQRFGFQANWLDKPLEGSGSQPEPEPF
jgi:hypothetical protein